MIYTITLSPALDRTLIVDGFQAGKLNRAMYRRDDAGGKGINVSKTICSLGGTSTAIAIAGGESGKFIAQSLADIGIRHDFIWTNHETRTNIKIADRKSGTTTEINETAQIDAKDAEKLISKLEAQLKPNDIAVIAGKINSDAVDITSWIERIKSKRARVFLDTEGEALIKGASASPQLIKPNESEFRLLCTNQAQDVRELALQAKDLAQRNQIEFIALSLGRKGAVFVKGDEVCVSKALDVPVACTVGAGDSMMAALAYGVHQNLSFEHTCALAVACSAAAVSCEGTLSPSRHEINKLLPSVKLEGI